MQRDSGPLVPLHWIGFGYAALVASGGIIGYAKAGSVPSLAAGLLFGSLAGLGAYQLSQDPRNIWVFLATSGTLAGIMGMRFYHSGKFMPAGLIAGARYFLFSCCSSPVWSVVSCPPRLWTFKNLLVLVCLMLDIN
uniref:transmembrane protein 14C isoform X1 n=1 Tax=Odobenus rosmarus divergens TaxID=9708 RepID=UPI00063CF2E2|nr:PREDICTED: transmembrane protein 14C isoform X1 [Odobenus rosmarus divergens]